MPSGNVDVPPLRLSTPRLELIAADARLARADAARDRQTLAALLDARVPDEWPPALTVDVLEFFAGTLAAHPEQAGWWGWYWVRAERAAVADCNNSTWACAHIVHARQRVLIGGGGFKGPPDPGGTVEIGYSVLDEFQRHGYATEAMRALVEWCLQDPRVRTVVAETFPNHSPSLRVMQKLGLRCVGPGHDPGTVRYARRRDTRASTFS